MRILALDAATAACSVALLSGGGVVAYRLERLGRGHAERLMPMVLEVVAEAGIDFPALDRLAVTIGPGTFTGVRIGLAAARGLALAAARPLVGVTTLETLAFQARDAASPGGIAAAVAAGPGWVYLQVFGPDLAPVGPPAALPLAEAAQRIPPGAVLAGDIEPELAAKLSPGVVLRPAVLDARAVGLLAERHPLPDRPPAPLYVRAPDARLARRPPWAEAPG